MAKLNTRSAATAIGDTDIFLKDNTGSTTSEKVTGALLRSEILNGLNWVVQDSAAYALVMGDRIVANVLGADRAFTLPATFNVTDNTNNIWVWNSSSDAFNITLTPAASDNLVVNGTALAGDATFTIPKGVMVLIIPKVTDTTWGVITVGLIGGEGTAVNGAALDLDVNSLTTETTVDTAADYMVFFDATNSDHRKILFDNVPRPKNVSVKTSTTLGVAATTFAATTSFVVLTGDAGTNTISTITGGVEGQTLTILFVDALVTITDTDAHTADTVDLSAAFTSADDTTLTLIYDGTSWYETSRSVN